MMTRFLLVLSGLIWASCSGRTEQAPATSGPRPVLTSPLGVSYFEPERPAAQQAKLDSNLAVAKTNFEDDPSEDNYIWYGRREGYLLHLDEAIRIFTDGIADYPDSYRLYRHRGHRYISLRKFDEAVADLERAALLMQGQPLETEPDGQPNKINQPLSTTQFNVWYHLGLARYLRGDFEGAIGAYVRCLEISQNDDSRVAVWDWLYMSLRRVGRLAEALKVLKPIPNGMTIVENESYYTRLKMYKGWLTPDQVLTADSTSEDYDLNMATQGYGVGNWYYYNGDTAKATAVFEKVVSGKFFSAFGFIAAENELARAKPAR